MEATDASRLAWREQPSLPLRSSLAPLPFRQSRGILYVGRVSRPTEGTMKYTAIVNLLAASLRRPTASNSLAVSQQAAEPNHCESRDPVPSVVRGSFVVKFLLAPVVCTCVSASARQSRALCCVREFGCKILVGFQNLSLWWCAVVGRIKNTHSLTQANLITPPTSILHYLST